MKGFFKSIHDCIWLLGVNKVFVERFIGHSWGYVGWRFVRGGVLWGSVWGSIWRREGLQVGVNSLLVVSLVGASWQMVKWIKNQLDNSFSGHGSMVKEVHESAIFGHCARPSSLVQVWQVFLILFCFSFIQAGIGSNWRNAETHRGHVARRPQRPAWAQTYWRPKAERWGLRQHLDDLRVLAQFWRDPRFWNGLLANHGFFAGD